MSSLISNEDAPIVTRIFETYAQEETSLRSVARSLNADGISGPKRTVWDNVTLSVSFIVPCMPRPQRMGKTAAGF